ncbi:MAG: glycosyltransferase family 4 protein [Planctomycetaceae bacterium]|nr:glycosyltransferase family 4 protein [Planctomycetaceae bacterium]
MKIAHIITRLIIGGAQENTVHTVEDHISQYDDDVTLMTGPAMGPEGSLIPRAQESGCNLIILEELRRSIHPLRELAAYRKLKQHLRELKPDIVHTHSSKAGILGRRAAASLKIPCVHTIHGAAFHYGQHPVLYHTYKLSEKIAARWTDHYISVANAMSEQYLEAGISVPEKYTTIHSGFVVDPFLAPPENRDAQREAWGLTPENVLIGKIGRLFPLKGHDSILAVAGEVVRRCPQARFLFIGDGILRQQFEAEIEAAGLQNYFIFTGLVPPTEIPQLMHTLDILVHTSQWEGLARVLPQALITGKPVVSFDIDGAKEVVINNETGFLIPRNDLEGLTNAMVQLVEDSKLRNRLGNTGRDKFTDLYRHQTMSRKIREVYQRVLDSQ